MLFPAPPPSPVHRAVCYRCHKAQVTCVCSRVPRVQNRTPISILQHPRERLHSIGTARFAGLGLANVRVEVAWNAGEKEEHPPPWLPPDAALLYPSADARDLAQVAAAELPRHLVVIDGTWHTARTLHRDKAWLRRLPHYRLSPGAPSRYRIRREPARDHLSTIEAIVQALKLLEPDTAGLDALLGAFDGMIDEQLVFIRRGEGMVRTRDRRPREWRRTPRALVEDFDRLVVAYAESSRADPRGGRELVQLAAVELGTGRLFEQLVRPTFGAPSPTHLAHMQLSAEDFGDAPPLETLALTWSRFVNACGASPLVAAWNQSTLDLIADAMKEPASRVSLKSAFRNARGGGSGSLDEVSAAEGLAIRPLPLRGRAALRLARAVVIAREMNSRARGAEPTHPPDLRAAQMQSDPV